VTELMKQVQYAPLSISDMAITLFAVNNGYFDDVEVGRVLAFENGLQQFVKTKNAALVSKILSAKELDAEGEKQLVAAIEEFKKSWA
jgi:F-type H+-transporting ATPase subunit alpha